MRKLDLLVPVLLLALVLSPALAVAKTEPTAPEIEQDEAIAVELEQLFVQLTGTSPENPTIRKHGKNFYSMSAAVGGFSAAATTASQFRILDVGQQTSIPQNPRYLVSAVLISARTIPNYWWAVWNGSGEDRTASTRVTVKGAGREHMRLEENLTYRAGEITIHWDGVNRQIEHPGIYTIKAKVVGAGRDKASYLVE